MKKEGIFRLALIASLSLASLAHADQILYDGFTGIPSASLSSPDQFGAEGLYDIPDGFLFGYLEDDILYDRKGIHSIGHRLGECLYLNNGYLLGCFKASVPPPEVPRW